MLSKNVTAKDLPPVYGGMKSQIHSMYEKSEGLNISSMNKKALTDLYVSSSNCDQGSTYTRKSSQRIPGKQNGGQADRLLSRLWPYDQYCKHETKGRRIRIVQKNIP